MNVMKKMNELTDLTNNERLIVDYINQHPREFLESKPKELVKKIYVSLPTLYRLVNKLGLDGINDLKVEVAGALQEREKLPIQNYDYPILPTDTCYQVMNNLGEVYRRTVKETMDAADPGDYLHVVQLMAKAKVIDVYTTAAQVFFAQNFQFQMKEIDANVNVPTEEYYMRMTASYSDRTHLALIISFGGRGHILHDIVKILKEKNTDIVLITSTQENPLAEYARYKLYMASFENHHDKISSFSTRMTLLYILDTLYSIYFKRNYVQNVEKKQESYRRIAMTYERDDEGENGHENGTCGHVCE